LSKRQEIDYAENKKERVTLLSIFPPNLLFLALAIGANAKARDPEANNQELGPSSIKSTFFG
jgi:hypothetical protein